MKSKVSRNEVIEKIREFFEKDNFRPEEVRKIKRLAMKYRIRMKEERKSFCKNCLSKLKGKTRVSRFYKIIECEVCGVKNKFKISQRN